jgi:UDP-GlcNAc:undecaprenyl-phosphate/decaprenyl-phosphate GlcNAc-1-phosphate transferase
MSILLVAAVTIFALLINLVLTPGIIRIAHRFRWYDRPGSRKIHTVLVPRLGGVGIFTSFFLSIIFVPLVGRLLFGDGIPQLVDLKFLSLFLGFFIIYLLGLIDDFYSLKAVLKLFIQICAAAVVVIGGDFVVHAFTIPYLGRIDLWYFAYPLTIFWIVAITNAVNLVDGMDGLGAGIAGFAALSLGVISLLGGETAAAVISFGLFGALLGFLRYNFPPAKIFMGDSGSLFLGFVLATIPLLGISRAGSLGALLIPVTILLVPIIDTLAAIIRRLRKRQSIASPDKEHIHHKLLALGLGEKKILLVIYSVCAYLSGIAITSVVLPQAVNVFIIIVVWIGLLLGYGIIHLLQSRKKEAQNANKNNMNGKSSAG